MEINYIAIVVATVVQFIVGAIWYMPLFGKAWGEIHGFDTVAPEMQKEMQKEMMPMLVVQFVLTLITSAVFGLFVATLPQDWNVYGLAGFYWLGFVVPTQIPAVLFGGTEGKWVVKKILISSGASLLCFMSMALVFALLA
jgi:hypothetical protein